MADPEQEHEVLSALVRLMSTGDDMSDFSDEQLIATARVSREFPRLPESRVAFILHTRGWTWEKIGDAIGVDLSTAYRWAQEYKRRTTGT